MTWSLNEIEALSRKAARGAGYSWGLADEAGRAVRWLEARGEPGATALLELLSWRDGKAYPSTVPGQASVCPIVAGTMLCDGVLLRDEIDGLPLHSPLLMQPFIAWLEGPGETDPAARANVPTDVAAALDAYATRTYAPATEASRLAGAGAGLSDND